MAAELVVAVVVVPPDVSVTIDPLDESLNASTVLDRVVHALNLTIPRGKGRRSSGQRATDALPHLPQRFLILLTAQFPAQLRGRSLRQLVVPLGPRVFGIAHQARTGGAPIGET